MHLHSQVKRASSPGRISLLESEVPLPSLGSSWVGATHEGHLRAQPLNGEELVPVR